MFKNILLIVVAIAINSGCSTTPTTTPVTVKKDSFLQELALANPQLQEQAGDQMVSDWKRMRHESVRKFADGYPKGWSTQGEEGLARYEKWRSQLRD